MGPQARPQRGCGWLVALLLICGSPAAHAADELILLVQPPAWRDDAAGFDARPLAQVLSGVLARPVRARVSDDALSHWRAVVAAPAYQLALDEAHFTDYRRRRHAFTAVLRDVDDARFQLVVRPRTLVTSPSDLAARRVAAPEPPSLGAVRLMDLFAQLARAPRLEVVRSRAEAVFALGRGEVAAALLPIDAMGGDAGVEAALVTDVSPGRALSVAPELGEGARNALTRAFASAALTPAARRALEKVGVRAFEATSDDAYEDSARLLRGTWGYR